MSWSIGRGLGAKFTDFSPKAVQHMMERHHLSIMQAELSKDLGTSDTLILQPIKHMAASKKHSPVQRGLIRTFATGALWTNSRSSAAGYDVALK